MKIIFLFFFWGFSGILFSQDIEVVERDFVQTRNIRFRESLLHIHSEILVPNVMAYPGFRHCFKGIYHVGGSINIRLARGFFMGIGGANSLISTQERLQAVDIRMQLYTATLRFSYHHYHSEKSYSSFGVNFGENHSFFTDVVPIHSPVLDKTYSSFIVEPNYSINFIVDENFTIGMFASYSLFLNPFNPYNIALQDYSSQSVMGDFKPPGFLNFGFCFYVGIGKRFKVDFPEKVSDEE